MDDQTLSGEHHVTGFNAAETPAMRVRCAEPFTVITRDRFAAMPAGGEPVSAPGNVIGPVHIEGVRAGQVLAVDIIDVEPATGTGYLLASPGYGILGDRVEARARTVPVTADSVQLTPDTLLRARPMIGKLGVAPPEGTLPSTSAGPFGGALSATQIGPGSTLLVQASEDGAGLCLEDVHALMGDGEATASAVEISAAVRLSCSVYDGPALPALPVLLSDAEAVVFGEGKTLDAACEAATEAMLALLMCRRGVDVTEAALLVGAAVDVRVSFFGKGPRRARAAVPRGLAKL